MNKYIYM